MLIIKFSLENVELHLAGNTDIFPETNASIHVYGNAELGPMKERPDGPELEQGLIIEEPFKSDKIFTLCFPDPSCINEHSSLCLSLYATSILEGSKYLIMCGTDLVGITTQLATQKYPVRVIVEFVNIHNSLVEKGNLVLNVRSLDLDQPRSSSCVKLPPNLGLMLDQMRSYIARSANIHLTAQDEQKCYFERPRYNVGKYPYTNPKLRGIMFPYYPTEIPNVLLPGTAFANVMPRSRPDEAYFVNLIKSALLRIEMTEEQFITAIRQQISRTDASVTKQCRQAASAIATACTLYAQSRPYVPDHVNGHDFRTPQPFDPKEITLVEDMENLRVMGGSDCEEMGQDTVITARTLKGHFGNWSDPLLRATQDLLQHYVVILTQGGVSSSSASDAQKETDRFIAHIYGVLMPHGKAKRLAERTNSDPSLLGLTKDVPSWSYNMDILIMEGTGTMTPIMLPEWAYGKYTVEQVKQRVDLQAKFERTFDAYGFINFMQTPLNDSPTTSVDYNDFYKYVVCGMLPYDSKRTAVDISFVYVKEKTCGVALYDLIMDVENVGIVYNELITEEEKTIALHLLGRLKPVPQLHPRSSKLVAEDEKFFKDRGVKKWAGVTAVHVCYLLPMYKLKSKPQILEVKPPFELQYKYFALDDDNAYVELCVYYCKDLKNLQRFAAINSGV